MYPSKALAKLPRVSAYEKKFERKENIELQRLMGKIRTIAFQKKNKKKENDFEIYETPSAAKRLLQRPLCLTT